MFEKDYIMRSIQQFGDFLSRVLSSISRGNTGAAEQELKTAADKHLGLRMDFILGMSNDDVLRMFGRSRNLDVEKVYVVGQLLFCEATRRAVDNNEGSGDLYLRSLGLLLWEYPLMDEEYEGGATPSIEQILKALGDASMPPDICEQLMVYHEARGEFAKAENRLFDLLDHEVDSVLQLGESFYARIPEYTDEELSRGNLPREEVTEGLRAFRARCRG